MQSIRFLVICHGRDNCDYGLSVFEYRKDALAFTKAMKQEDMQRVGREESYSIETIFDYSVEKYPVMYD